MVLEGETPRSEGTLYATGEEQDLRPISTRSDDALELNPKGGKITDVAGHEKRRLSFARRVHRIGTWNVRSLYTGKMDIVLREMAKTGVQMMGIGEVRWAGGGHFRSGDYSLFFSGHETTRANGVAVICHKEITAAVMGYNPINDRIMTIRLQGKPMNLTFIQVYAPTTAADEEELQRFYGVLQETIDDAPKGDLVIIGGDMNAKVGECEASRATGKFGLGDRNEAGERLLEFCEANDMKIMNTYFKQPKRRLYTWTSPDGRHRNQIDYILCANRWRSSIQSTHTRPGADCGSDHEMLVAEVRTKLKKTKLKVMPARYDMDKISDRYRVDVANRFSALDLLMKEPEEMWQEIKNAALRSAATYVPKATRGKKKPWLSEAALRIADKRRKTKASGVGKEAVKKLNANFQRQARRDKEQFIANICEQLERDNKQGKSRDLFKKVKEITGKFIPRKGTLTGKGGESLQEAKDIIDRWRAYTEELYKKDNTITE